MKDRKNDKSLRRNHEKIKITVWKKKITQEKKKKKGRK